MANILSTGISALNAYQRQLATTGHNIANVNTEGYSRQRVQLETLEPNSAGSAGYIGNGVGVASIRRSYDEYLTARVRTYTATSEEYATYQARASQVDNVIGDADSGVDETLRQFFAALQDVADDPTSIPARQVVLNRAEVLADRFNSLGGWLQNLRAQTNQEMALMTGEMNGIAASIVAVNQRIQEVNGNTSSSPPNDLLDQRDRLLDQLSKYTNVSTLTQDDGSMNVFIGTGQPLVVGASYNTLAVAPNPEASDRAEIYLVSHGGARVPITDSLSGGRLDGLKRFRDEVLDPAENALGRVAIGLASFFNDEHRTGMDLDGNLGGDFFSVGQPQILANPANTGSVGIAFDDVADLTTHEYQLSYDGAAWTLTDLHDASTVALSGAGTVANPYVADGFALVMGGGAAAGDTYRIRPSRSGASGIGLIVRDARDIAAAEAVATADVSTNSGTGHIGAGAQTASTGTTPLAAPITLTFDGTTKQFNLSSGGTLAYDPSSDSGKTLSVSIAGLGDFGFRMTGTPADGDRFTLSDNNGGVGDNRNAARLAALQSRNVMIGGNATLADAYGQMIADVGTRTAQAKANSDVQSKLLTQTTNAKDSVSGVNLDEEAADLVRFQQAYQAAAQVISVANTLFDTLLGAVRR